MIPTRVMRVNGERKSLEKSRNNWPNTFWINKSNDQHMFSEKII